MRHSKYIWTWILTDFGLALCGERIKAGNCHGCLLAQRAGVSAQGGASVSVGGIERQNP